MEELFSILCHRLENRSPSFNGEIFPLCFRCAGLYAGIFFSQIALHFNFKKLLTEKGLIFSSILSLPWVIDGAGNFFNLWNSHPVIRSASGILLAIFLSIVMHDALKEKSNSPKKILPFSAMFLSGAISFLFINLIENSALFFEANKIFISGGLIFITFFIIKFIGLKDINAKATYE